MSSLVGKKTIKGKYKSVSPDTIPGKCEIAEENVRGRNPRVYPTHR